MRLTILLILASIASQAQNNCEDFLTLMGQRDISQVMIDFKEQCGPFEETFADDKSTKSWTSLEKGIDITFINREEDKAALPKYEVLTIELTSFTSQGGYKGKLPLGFEMGMDWKMVRDHIKKSKEMTYDRSEVGIRRSYTNYSGPINDVVKDRKLRVYVSQYDGRSITIMRLRLK